MLSNSFWVIIDFIIFCLLLYYSGYGATITTTSKIKPYTGIYYKPIIYFGIIFFCLYNKTEGDYFHYQKILVEIISTKYPTTHLEWPYIKIINIIGNKYLLFRLIVWGSAFIITRSIYKINKIDNDWGWFCFILINLLAFAYIRAALGISLFYLGYTYIQCHKLKNIILGIIICILGTLFHKSILLLILIGIVIPFFKLNLKSLIILCLMFPIFLKLLYWGLGDILIGWGNIDAIRYFNNNNSGYGIGAKIQVYLIYLSIIILLFSFIRKNNKNHNKINRIDYIYLKFITILTYLSMILLCFDYGVYDLVTRVREMAYMPLAIVIGTSLKYSRTLSKTTIIGILIFFFSDLSYFAYMYYLKQIGSGI